MSQPTTPRRNLALFDMDGTLLAWDTQVLFAGFVCARQPWRRLLFLPFLFMLPLIPLHMISKTLMKRLFLGYLKGLTPDRLEQLSRHFAQVIVTRFMFPEVIDRLRQHQRQGDLCVLATASPDFYAKFIGLELGFDYTMATQVKITAPQMPLCPALPQGNHKGSRKVSNFKRIGILDHTGTIITAYSDSSADLPMLNLATQKVLINPSSKLRSLLPPSEHIEIITTPLPWKNTLGKIMTTVKFLLGFGKFQKFFL